VVFRVKWGE